jgi:5-methyltetrahydropteroyltriglutamate--homocysteine methyltransferase
MKTSQDRILTTHVGSLPRNPVLSDLLIRQERGENIQLERLRAEKQRAVADVVERQVLAGVDVINDGEQPRVGFQTYVPQRMKGFGGSSRRAAPADYRDFPDFTEMARRRFPHRSKVSDAPMAVAEVRYDGLGDAGEEIDLFEGATQPWNGRFSDRFMTAASPGIIATTMHNSYYDSHENYVFALAREMRKEYELIVDRGFVLQLDAPDLAMERTMLFQDKPLSEFLAVVELHVAALNAALANIPKDRVRLHCCWGNWEGPHTHDVPLSDILPLLYTAKVGALSLEFANPRHQHEMKTLRKLSFPDDKILLPGIIDSTSNYVEHPELIADRICDAVSAVGDRTRVIASSDCGFGTFTGYEFVAASVVWAKLRALNEGAALATRRLWQGAA